MARPSRIGVPLLLLLSGVLFVCHRPLRAGVLFIVRFPLLVVHRSLSTLMLLPRLPSLIQDQRRLQTELARREMELTQARELLRQHQQAAALTQIMPDKRRGIIASVISRSFLPTQHTLLLDHGRRDGIVLESVVINAEGVLGRVIDAHDTTAAVLLLTDAESRVAGMVERSRETGLLIGRLQGQCELSYLGAQADVQVGDRVVTAGLGGPFPKGLLLGTVVEVMRDASSGEAWATVDPAVHLGRVEDVLCVPP